MLPRTFTRLAAALVLLGAACDGAPATGPKARQGPGEGEGARDERPAERSPESAAERSATGDAAAGELGRVTEDGLLRIDAVLGKTPTEVDALLGKPTQQGTPRISCVRFLPERVFFACEEEVRVYEQPATRLKMIEVDFEDGKAAAVALIGLPGEGLFDPATALSLAGLVLPGEPQISQPEHLPPNASSVTVWSYWNSSARLLIGGLQYRVEISIVDDDWARSKVKILVNHPLDESQLARVKSAKTG